MKYIFEDNETMRISQLLISIYGDDAIFAHGNRNIIDSMLKYEDSVCFIDVSPDNYDTVDKYLELCVLFGVDRVFEFPCIEFSAMFMLFAIGINFPKRYIDSITNLLKGIGINYTAKSLERFLKGVLNEHYLECVRNHEVNERLSIYEHSCDCVGYYANHCNKTVNFDKKTEYFLRYLPFEFSMSDRRRLYNRFSESIRTPVIYPTVK